MTCSRTYPSPSARSWRSTASGPRLPNACMRSWVSPPHRISSPRQSAARSASSTASARAVRSTWPVPRAAPRVGCLMSPKAMDDADAEGMSDADDLLALLWGGDEPEDAGGPPVLLPEQALGLPL